MAGEGEDEDVLLPKRGKLGGLAVSVEEGEVGGGVVEFEVGGVWHGTFSVDLSNFTISQRFCQGFAKETIRQLICC